MARRDISPTVRRIVDLTEGRFRVPLTQLRFGYDAIVGLLPGVGDLVGLVVGLALVVEAVRLRLPLLVVGRMIGNLVLDSWVGAIPLFGDLFDFAFKANHRNLELLERYA